MMYFNVTRSIEGSILVRTNNVGFQIKFGPWEFMRRNRRRGRRRERRRRGREKVGDGRKHGDVPAVFIRFEI